MTRHFFSHHGFRFLLCVVLKRIQGKWQSVNHFFYAVGKHQAPGGDRGDSRFTVFLCSHCSDVMKPVCSYQGFQTILRTKLKLTLASFSYFLISACRVGSVPMGQEATSALRQDFSKVRYRICGNWRKRKSTSWIKRTHKLFWFKFWGIAKCDLQILLAELCKCCIVILFSYVWTITNIGIYISLNK